MSSAYILLYNTENWNFDDFKKVFVKLSHWGLWLNYKDKTKTLPESSMFPRTHSCMRWLYFLITVLLYNKPERNLGDFKNFFVINLITY